jgi:hypothetical protein
MIYYLRAFILNLKYITMGKQKQSRDNKQPKDKIITNPENIIKGINKSCQHYFNESTFVLSHILSPHGYRYIISGNHMTKALNLHKNDKEEVKVLKWFDNFWLYIDIRFEKSETDMLNTFISLSVFQGQNYGENKTQLFRAEWDNFDNDDRHPQPHWHIYSDHDSKDKNFVELIDENKGEENFENFLKQPSIDIKRFHFAMNGDWANSKDHTHKLTDEETIINWFKGLLGHIKHQLDYVSKLNTNSAKLN